MGNFEQHKLVAFHLDYKYTEYIMKLNHREKAYQNLRQDILFARFTSGQAINDHEYAKRLGFSRTPVREALLRLESDGLVEVVPRLGMVVKRVSRKDLSDMFGLREAIEAYGAQRAAACIDHQTIGKLTRLCDELMVIARQLRDAESEEQINELFSRQITVDIAFHVTLLGAAQNDRLLKVFKDSRLLLTIFCHSARPPRQALLLDTVQTYRCHRRLLRAVCNGSGEAARRLVEEHMRVSCTEILAQYDKLHGEDRESFLTDAEIDLNELL